MCQSWIQDDEDARTWRDKRKRYGDSIPSRSGSFTATRKDEGRHGLRKRMLLMLVTTIQMLRCSTNNQSRYAIWGSLPARRVGYRKKDQDICSGALESTSRWSEYEGLRRGVRWEGVGDVNRWCEQTRNRATRLRDVREEQRMIRWSRQRRERAKRVQK